MSTSAPTPVTLINVFTVEPANQQRLVDLLRENTETIIKTLKGWITTTLISSADGKQVVIYSQWATADDV